MTILKKSRAVESCKSINSIEKQKLHYKQPNKFQEMNYNAQVNQQGMGIGNTGQPVYLPQHNDCKVYSTALKVLGVIQLFLGVLALICSIGSTVTSSPLGFVFNSLFFNGSGYYVGVLLILSGGFAIAAGSTKNNYNVCMGRTSMILSIFTSIGAINFIGYSAIALGFASTYDCSDNHDSINLPFNSNFNSNFDSSTLSTTKNCDNISVLKGFYATLLFCALAELVISIITAAFCCASGFCCCGRNRNAGVIIMNGQPNQVVIHNSSVPNQAGYPNMANQQSAGYDQPPSYPSKNDGAAPNYY